MKQLASFLLLAVFATVSPQSASALSCMNPEGMVDQYVSSPDYVIFSATAGETIEHVKQAAKTDGDPNFQFDSGYTGQNVTVTENHKGSVEGSLWVYHQKNSTWGYMCSSGPGEAGSERLFIITPPNGTFDLPQVVNSYAIDSPLAIDLIVALEAAEDNGPAYVNFTTDSNWRQNLSTQIREMMFMIRVKFAEWRFWVAEEV